MSVVSRLFSHKKAQLALFYGAAPVAFAGLAGLLNMGKLDAPARTADYQSAQQESKDLGTFLNKAKPGEEYMIEAYNMRRAYTAPVAQAVLAGCMQKALSQEGGQIEIAQTASSARMSSYRAPMATELLGIRDTAVAVMPLNRGQLVACAEARMQEARAVPDAEESRTEFFNKIATGLLAGGIAGFIMHHRQRELARNRQNAAPAISNG